MTKMRRHTLPWCANRKGQHVGFGVLVGHHAVWRGQFLNTVHFNHVASKPNKLHIIRNLWSTSQIIGVEKTPVVRTKGFGCPVNPCDFFNLPNKKTIGFQLYCLFLRAGKNQSNTSAKYDGSIFGALDLFFYPTNTSSYYIYLSTTKCPQFGAFLASTCNPQELMSYMKQISPQRKLALMSFGFHPSRMECWSFQVGTKEHGCGSPVKLLPKRSKPARWGWKNCPSWRSGLKGEPTWIWFAFFICQFRFEMVLGAGNKWIKLRNILQKITNWNNIFWNSAWQRKPWIGQNVHCILFVWQRIAKGHIKWCSWDTFSLHLLGNPASPREDFYEAIGLQRCEGKQWKQNGKVGIIIQVSSYLHWSGPWNIYELLMGCMTVCSKLCFQHVGNMFLDFSL